MLDNHFACCSNDADAEFKDKAFRVLREMLLSNKTETIDDNSNSNFYVLNEYFNICRQYEVNSSPFDDIQIINNQKHDVAQIRSESYQNQSDHNNRRQHKTSISRPTHSFLTTNISKSSKQNQNNNNNNNKNRSSFMKPPRPPPPTNLNNIKHEDYGEFKRNSTKNSSSSSPLFIVKPFSDLNFFNDHNKCQNHMGCPNPKPIQKQNENLNKYLGDKLIHEC